MDAPVVTHPVVNALTIDVEDYFHVSAFAPYIARSSWDSLPCRIEQNIDRVLQLLADRSVNATFFTLGWIAERYPEMVRRIVAGGHELASHGYAHERAAAQGPDPFFADVALAKAVLEDIVGTEVQGYRAPSFSINDDNLWAYDCLAKAGYRYSSSVYPIRHDHYGAPGRSRFAHLASAGVLEVPIATVRLFRTNLPAGGGGYFRLMPYALSRWLIRRVNDADEESAVFYFHPWEIDPEQPRVKEADPRARFRHYINLERTATRLQLLLADFRWDRLDHVVFGLA
ncbi:MAG TPA: XrtA system polysaccharide deacetylase [Casimicrobiaceae bacterium]|nr:XrtA system polysaccharide deacetylase [Casimicrobiaceae bacterium]